MDSLYLWFALLAFALGAVAHEQDIHRQCANKGVAYMWITPNIECRAIEVPEPDAGKNDE